jgi:hypothetical protein
MDIASGLFALGGVSVAAAFTELRAWREMRTARVEALLQLRRETYVQALRQFETLAGKYARWVESTPAVHQDPTVKRAVWDEMTAAYETMNEVRLIAGNLGETEAAMNKIVRAFRDRLESDEQILPIIREERTELVQLFRRDLGID